MGSSRALIALVVLGLVGAGAAVASGGGKPIAGAIYQESGNTGGEFGPETPGISFAVSANGRTIEHVETAFLYGQLLCPGPAVGSARFAYQSRASITHGSFVVHSTGIVQLVKGKSTGSPSGDGSLVTISGSFTKAGFVHGHYEAVNHCTNFFTHAHSVKSRHGTFEASARPEGPHSEYCAKALAGGAAPNYAEHITAVSMTCREVDAALAAGAFTKEPDGLGFSTPGWMCTTIKGESYTCSKPPKQFRFLNGGQPPKA